MGHLISRQEVQKEASGWAGSSTPSGLCPSLPVVLMTPGWLLQRPVLHTIVTISKDGKEGKGLLQEPQPKSTSPPPEQATHLLQANHYPRRCVAPAWLRPIAFHPSELGPPPLKVLHSEQNKRSKAGVGGQPARSTVVTKESHPLSHCHKVPGERSKLQQRPPVCRQRTPKGAETGQTLAVKWLRFRRRWPK